MELESAVYAVRDNRGASFEACEKTEQICRFWCESDILGHSDIKRPGRPFSLEFYGYESGLEHFRLDRTQGKDTDS